MEFRGDERQLYFVPLAVEEGREDEALMPYAVARVRRGRTMGLMYGAASSPEFGIALVDAMKRGAEAPSGDGVIRFQGTRELDPDMELDPADVRRLGAEQSNTSIAFGSRMILKLYRRLQSGIHPELEVARFLTETAGFQNTPALLGVAEHVANDGTPTALAVLQQFVRNQGDAWRFTLEALKRELDTLLLLPESEAPKVEEVVRRLPALCAPARAAHRRAASRLRDADGRPSLRGRAADARRRPRRRAGRAGLGRAGLRGGVASRGRRDGGRARRDRGADAAGARPSWR